MAEYLERESILNAIRKASNLYVDQQGLYLSCELIAVMPATDVQPARFARWIDLDNRILCSGCGAGYDDYDEVKQNTYIFCPNCGARMDTEPDEPWQSE